jgi:formylglycine-generating enzyme required for sulfatase activity
MKHPIITSIGLAVLASVSLVTPASAGRLITTTTDSFGSGANAFTMKFVTVGNPGNDPDTTGAPNPAGAVASAFRMSTYEVSTAMVSNANTAGSLGITYTSRTADMPATSVSWNEAARFVNWLNASSGSVAAYKFSIQPGGVGYGANADIALWASGDAGYNAANPFRNSNAKYFLPSENEWYKAAYYSGTGSTYYNYATGSDSVPTAVASGTASGTAVYNGQSSPADITSAGGLSPYGTMGQGGNAWEWMETNSSGTNNSSDWTRGLRGGSWNYGGGVLDLASSLRVDYDPSNESYDIGFRVASSELAAVPEPTTLLSTLALVSSGLLLRRRGRISL